jgi:hypothetical protein
MVKLADGLKKMDSDVRNAVKKADSAGNKADKVKSKLAALEREL